MLTLSTRTAAQAVAADPALRRLKPSPDQLAAFGKQLGKLHKHLDPDKIERHGETHILDFLRDATPALGDGPAPERYGNVNGKRDLVLHLGDTAASPVGVVIEVKGPKNPAEMLTPTDLNRKAFQQLLLYYLEDRTDERADDFRRLVVTTGFEWYIFDALDFNALFWKNTALRKDFRDWKKGAKADTDTSFFYKSIAGKYLAAATGTLTATYVDLRGGLPTAPAALTDLWRVFGPAYLLKEFPASRPDPNTLNQEFYAELLYLMGLQEHTVGGVRRIGRCAEKDRQAGSLLENILYQMDIGHDLARVPAEVLAEYAAEPARQREEVALALCLMWVNRLLFLKLLEGQLVRYHPAEHAAAFRFLTPARVPEYDELNKLFFGVLNRPAATRPADVAAAFRELPYLNSSLFQPAVLEETVLYIRELNDRAGLAPFAGSVLKKKGAKAPQAAPDNAKQWLALPYLLSFLDAFDFGSDERRGGARPRPSLNEAGAAAPAEASGAEDDVAGAAGAAGRAGAGPAPTVVETPKPLLSAAVLGLVFEKINGYRDGSFYTPGFVTMYMARHTLRRAVVRRFTQGAAADKFPELRGCTDWQELRDSFDKKRRAEYAAHFNGLTVLDPAVGSGHFLVSALNELLALKADLRLLLDDAGQLLDYTLRVEHDELLVLDNATDLPARYQVATYDAATGQRTVADKYTRLQAALFREKRALMEHALFGVDLNPNSVRICRLRLWIELLKHAYYRPASGFQDLETLPNLDLNVRTGNSLVSRHALSAPLGQVFRSAGITVERYKSLVHDYFGASGQVARTALDAALADLKANVARRISKADPAVKKLADAELAVLQLEKSQSDLFGKKLDEESYAAELRKRQLLVEQRRRELADHQQGVFFQQAFEWRFEFPEVLDDDARFQGFDVVLGNPPYIRADEQNPTFRQRLMKLGSFVTLSEKWDIFVPFLELGYNLLAPGGEMAMIVSDGYSHAKYAKFSQEWFLANATIDRIDFLGKLKVFAGAEVYNVIPFIIKEKPTEETLPLRLLHEERFGNVRVLPNGPQPSLTYKAFSPNEAKAQEHTGKTVPLAELCYISKGMVPHAHEKLAPNAFKLGDLVSAIKDETHPKPFIEGKQLTNWTTNENNWLEWGTDRAPALFSRPTFSQLYSVKTKLLALRIAGQRVRVCLDEKQLLCNHTVIVFVPWHELKGVRNGSLKKTAQYPDERKAGKTSTSILREMVEKTSSEYDARYVLAVMHSTVAWKYLQSVRRSNTDLYPDDWKQLPIPAATAAQQAEIAALVETILAARAAEATADTAEAEARVDALVAALYGLTPAEAAVVGGA